MAKLFGLFLVTLLSIIGIVATQQPTLGLVSNTLGSHMVLQRAPQSARLWGWTRTPSQKVSVSFSGGNFETTSDASTRKWSISLPPQQAGGPFDFTVRAQDGEAVVLQNVMFGDIWVCSGQSNMEFQVGGVFNASQEIAKANNYPQVRLFRVGTGYTSDKPLENLLNVAQPWTPTTSNSIPGFSAVCWFFGRDLYDRYKIPIGLISTNWGGTYIQAWSSPDALRKCGALEGSKKAVQGANPNQPSVLWNAMIVPFLNMRVRGATWYQAESNVGQTQYYLCAQPAMITDWRQKWGLTEAEFPFFFVQLEPWRAGGNLYVAQMREAQAGALTVPYVGMASAVDLGDFTSPYGDIHPRDKQNVGKRLALVGAALAYGDQSEIYFGPTAIKATALSKPPTAEVRVDFAHLDKSPFDPEQGQKARCPTGLAPNYCGWFEIVANNGVPFNATTRLVGEGANQFLQLSATMPAQLEIASVRYGFADWPVMSLYNKAGIPAPPFNLRVEH